VITLILLLASFVFSTAIYSLGFFDGRGAAATFLLSITIIILSPPWWFFTIITGYVMIIVVTVYRRDIKIHIRGTRFREDKKRTYTNVLGKVVTPVIAAIMGNVGMFIASVSFGVADSTANEIGILSRRKPILITTGKSADPGTNGAVSLLGTFAGCVASIVLGFMISLMSFPSLLRLPILVLTLITGIVGNLFDSFLGSTIENRGFLTGWQVNFISSLAVGLLGLFMYAVFLQ
jgi:uncharacterized protein (TIGR00297 family)